MTLLALAEVIEPLVGPLAAFLAAVGVPSSGWLVRRAVRAISAHMQRVSNLLTKIESQDASIAAMAARLTVVESALAHITSEFLPNGGESLRDALDVLRVDIKVQCAMLDQLYTERGSTRFQCDAEGRCTHADPDLAAMFGLRAEEMLEFGWLMGVSTQTDRERVRNEWIAAINGRYPYSATYEVGPERTPVIATAKAVVCDGKVVRYLGRVTRGQDLPQARRKPGSGPHKSASPAPPNATDGPAS